MNISFRNVNVAEMAHIVLFGGRYFGGRANKCGARAVPCTVLRGTSSAIGSHAGNALCHEQTCGALAVPSVVMRGRRCVM